MYMLKSYEQTAVYDPYDPNQVRRVAWNAGEGYGTYFFNQQGDPGELKGLGFGFSGLPTWAQVGLVLAGSTALGYYGMKRFGASHIRPALKRIGINLSGHRSRRRR